MKFIDKYKSANFNKRKKGTFLNYIILHYTAMKDYKEALSQLCDKNNKVSSHFLINKSGDIFYLVNIMNRAWHAGKSKWRKVSDINSESIGIEIDNSGHLYNFENYTSKQIDSLIKLLKYISYRYGIKKHNILGHSDISPYRKIDPGEKFPWKILYKNKIGIWHNLKKVKLSFTRGEAISVRKVNLFMKNLSKFGYPGKSIIMKNKRKYKKLLVKAFQRRFRPELINGKIDQECLLILHNLLSNKA